MAGDLPHPGTEPMSLASPALAGRFSMTVPKYSEAMLNRGQELRSWRYLPFMDAKPDSSTCDSETLSNLCKLQFA